MKGTNQPKRFLFWCLFLCKNVHRYVWRALCQSYWWAFSNTMLIINSYFVDDRHNSFMQYYKFWVGQSFCKNSIKKRKEEQKELPYIFLDFFFWVNSMLIYETKSKLCSIIMYNVQSLSYGCKKLSTSLEFKLWLFLWQYNGNGA